MSGVQIVRADIRALPQRERVRNRVMPAGVGGEPVVLDQNVAVQKEQNIPIRRARAVVSRPREAEASVVLADNPQVQRGLRRGERGGGAVVNDYHLKHIARVGLPLQSRQDKRQLTRRGVVGDDYARGDGRRERIERRDVRHSPIVVPDGVGLRLHLGLFAP